MLGLGLGLDDYWLTGNLWISSSFRRKGSYFRFHMLLYKMVLLSSFIFIRQNLYQQSIVMWSIITLLFLQYCVVLRPFRCLSSNVTSCVCVSLLFVSVSFGLADSFHAVNALTVPSVQTIWYVQVG